MELSSEKTKKIGTIERRNLRTLRSGSAVIMKMRIRSASAQAGKCEKLVVSPKKIK